MNNTAPADQSIPAALLGSGRALSEGSFQKPVGGTFQEQLRAADPRETVVIGCIDYRDQEVSGYHLTAAGARVHEPMLEDLQLILHHKQFLVLQGHTDCAKTRSENPRRPEESDEGYRRRIDKATVTRLWRDATKLIALPIVREAMEEGLRFCVALHDVRLGQKVYFEQETKSLMARHNQTRLAA